MKSEHTFHCTNSFDKFIQEDESVHLVVTSPPYPMVEMWDDIFGQYNRGIQRSLKQYDGYKAFEKMHNLLDKTWQECYRVLRPGGFMIVNIGDATRSLDGHFQMYSNHSRIIQACAKIGFDVLPYIIWKKPTNSPTKFMGSGMLPAGAYVTLEHEHILIFRKEGKRSFTDQEKEKRRESALFWEERNQLYSDQWEILGTGQKLNIGANRDRSAAYPVDIALRLIMMYSMIGDTVIDPFSGTGTTTLAAMISGRNSLYMDNDQELTKSSQETLANQEWIGKINSIINQRVENHIDYCTSKGELFFKYRHNEYNIPIKTQQEKLLRLYTVKNIKVANQKMHVHYEKLNYPSKPRETFI